MPRHIVPPPIKLPGRRVECWDDRRPAELSAAVLGEQGLADARMFELAGCIRCGWTGHHARAKL